MHGKAAIMHATGWCLTATSNQAMAAHRAGAPASSGHAPQHVLASGTVQGEHGIQDLHVACRHLQGLALQQPTALHLAFATALSCQGTASSGSFPARLHSCGNRDLRPDS